MDSIIIFLNSHSEDNNLVIVIDAESVYLAYQGCSIYLSLFDYKGSLFGGF
jgi:hypothetical protein